jgi:predicted GTPase
MNRTRVIEHKGKRIILVDFAGIIDADEGLAAVAEARRFFAAQPADGTSLTLTDVRDTHYDRRIVEALKQMTAANRPIVKAAAVVSNSAIHQAAITMVALFSRRKLHVFDAREHALDWLVAQT